MVTTWTPPATGQNPYDSTLNTGISGIVTGLNALENRRDGWVVLEEARYPGCTSDVFATATTARDLAIADCFKDSSGVVTNRPRPLVLPPNQRSTAVASGSKAYHYSWNTLDLGAITVSYINASPTAGQTYNLNWTIMSANGADMYGETAIKNTTGSSFIACSSTYNHGNLKLRGFTARSRESLAVTDDFVNVPSGRAFYDLMLDSVSVQWYRYQLRGSFGRFFMRGLCNFNNAAAQPINLGGSDGSINAQLYVDSRALPAGTWLVQLSESTFRVTGQIYLTPNSGGGLAISGRCEGLIIDGVEMNGLGVQGPEYAYDSAQHVAVANLAGGSPNPVASSAPGLIYFNPTGAGGDNNWYKSNGTAWTLYYDGSAAIGFNGLVNRPATGTAGKVYQNTGTESFSTGGSNPTISYWVYWNSTWLGPSFWNQAPAVVASNGSLTPVYIGTDAPGILVSGTTGSPRITASMSLIGMVPGITNGAWDGGITVIDPADPVWVNAEVAFPNAGHPLISVRNSGAVAVAEVRADVCASQVNTLSPTSDLPGYLKKTGVVRLVDKGECFARISADQNFTSSTPVAITGLDIYLKANEVIAVEGEFYLTGLGDATSNGDVIVTHAGPSGYTNTMTYSGPPTSTTTGQSTVGLQKGQSIQFGTLPSGSTTTMRVTGTLKASTTPGTFTISLAQVVTNASATTLQTGSYLRWRIVQ